MGRGRDGHRRPRAASMMSIRAVNPKLRFHLYLDGVTLTHDKFELLIKALAECGIIGPDYAKYSLDRGYTSVRLPWIKKSEDDTDSE